MLACEGIVAHAEERINALAGAAWEWWVDLNYRLAKDPSLYGSAVHLLYIGQKRQPQAEESEFQTDQQLRLVSLRGFIKLPPHLTSDAIERALQAATQYGTQETLAEWKMTDDGALEFQPNH
jgi:hypothetical protein